MLVERNHKGAKKRRSKTKEKRKMVKRKEGNRWRVF